MCILCFIVNSQTHPSHCINTDDEEGEHSTGRKIHDNKHTV